MAILNRIAAFEADMTAWRRDLHLHPEPAFAEHRTSALMQEKLTAFGVDAVVTGLAGTGVVGVIHGREAGSEAIGLRADIDALPIVEATGLPYASATPGVMHACGHDGHTAVLLGAARYLAETRNFAGPLVQARDRRPARGGLRLHRAGDRRGLWRRGRGAVRPHLSGARRRRRIDHAGLRAAEAVVGRDKVLEMDHPTMGGEDFSFMLDAKIGNYITLGAARGTDDPQVHHPAYDFNDAVLTTGASY